MPIHFFSEQTPFVLREKTRTREWLEKCIKSQRKKTGELNFIFCSDPYLRRINKQYLNHDYFTDIITFPSDGDGISGDIYISIDRVRDNARAFGSTSAAELRRVMAHGVLHLSGYNDKTKSQQYLMRKMEDKFLKMW
jgi:probable rRNA maturation factor